MAVHRHQYNEYELGQTVADGEGQGGLVCCSAWGHRVGHDRVTEQQQAKVLRQKGMSSMEVGWKEVTKKAKRSDKRGDGVYLTEYGEKHFDCHNQQVPTKGTLCPTLAVLPTKIQICPMPSPRTVGRECPNLRGETGWSSSSGSLAFLEDSCWNAGQIWHQCDFPLAWWRDERVSFVFFLLFLPTCKLDSSHYGFRWKQCKTWRQKFHSGQNFVVLPDLWALRLYFNPQFITSK